MLSDALLRKRLAESVEYILESLTRGSRSEAKYKLARLAEDFGKNVRIHDPFYADVLRDLRDSSDLLTASSNKEDREALRLLWEAQKRLRSR
jgi:hypothetical protein